MKLYLCSKTKCLTRREKLKAYYDDHHLQPQCPVVCPTESCWRPRAALPTPSRAMGSRRGTGWPFTCQCHRWLLRPCWHVPVLVQFTLSCSPASAQRLWQGGSRMVSLPESHSQSFTGGSSQWATEELQLVSLF